MHMNSGLVRYVICWSSSILLNRLRAFVLRKEMRVEEDAGLLVPNLEGVFFNFFHTFPCNTLFVRQTGFSRHFWSTDNYAVCSAGEADSCVSSLLTALSESLNFQGRA